MTEAVLSLARNFLHLWTELVRRYAWPVVVISAVATIACALYVAGNFAFNTSPSNMFSEDLPFRRLEEKLNAAFPHDQDTITVVIEGPSPGLADDAGDRLADGLRQRPELFRGVFDLQGNPFFRRNGLLYLDVDDLHELSDRLIEAQPFIDALWRDPSLRGLFGLLSLAIDVAIEEPDKAVVDISPILNEIAAVVEAQADGSAKSVSWRRLMSGSDEEGVYRRFLQLQITPDYGRFRAAEPALEAIRSMAAELGFDGDRGYRVRLTGDEALKDEELQSVSLGTGMAGLLSLVSVMGLLLLCFRSPRLLAASLFTLIAGLVWTAGFAVAAVGPVNLISVAFAVLFIGLSVDFGIHFSLRYRESKEAGSDHGTALEGAVKGVGGAIALSAVAAAIGFYSFLPTDYIGLAELGLIAGTGMIIAMFASFTVLPAFITILEPRLRKPVPWVAFVRFNLADWIQRHYQLILGMAVVLALASLALAPLAHFDFDPLNLRDRDSESVSTLLELMEDDPTIAYSITVLARDLPSAVELADRMDVLENVHSTRTLADFVPKNQDEKLDVIANLALFLEPTFVDEQVAPPDESEQVIAFRSFQDKLQRLAAQGESPMATAAARLRGAFTSVMRQRVGNPDAFQELSDRLLGGLSGRLHSLRETLAAEAVTLDSLPAQLRDRWIANDGRARVEIYPNRDVAASRALLRSFVESVQAIAPEAAGAPVIILEAGKAVMSAFLEAAGIAVVLIALMLAVVFRRAADTVIVFVPLLLAALLTVAASVLIGIPFNFANVIVLPLLFGLGVAGSLHLVVREAKTGDDSEMMSTSTPRAVLFSALTTIASFGSLAMSQHPGTSGMGVLLTVSISLTLVCTIVVLPALMVVARKIRRSNGGV
ncbi:MAG: MMPL family transporter [Rhodospirillales bacterium]|nr:MMPL family transporter [Rhodospirillales bacterium]